MSTPGCIELDEVAALLDVVGEGLLAQDVETLVGGRDLGLGDGLLQESINRQIIYKAFRTSSP